MKPLVSKALWALFTAIPLVPAYAQDKNCAMVLLHGKWGDTSYISHFGRRIEPVCVFKAIEMPWSQRRSYDKSYQEAIEEIAKEIQVFRSQGYKRVVIAGHSFGANAGLAYMAVKGDADAIIGLAPGHSPSFMFYRGVNKEIIHKAKELMKENRGDERVSFVDQNQNLPNRSFSVAASTFLSYFDPDGIGTMAVSAKEFKNSVPVLLVVGTRDSSFLREYIKEKVFTGLPNNPKNKLVMVEADHNSTEAAAVPFVLDWLKDLR